MWRWRIRFAVWQLMVVLAATAPLIYLSLTLLIMPMQMAAMDTGCRANLRAIVLALHNYHLDYGCYPPPSTTYLSGRPTHSWRALILPYAGERALYQSYRLDE